MTIWFCSWSCGLCSWPTIWLCRPSTTTMEQQQPIYIGKNKVNNTDWVRSQGHFFDDTFFLLFKGIIVFLCFVLQKSSLIETNGIFAILNSPQCQWSKSVQKVPVIQIVFFSKIDLKMSRNLKPNNTSNSRSWNKMFSLLFLIYFLTVSFAT